MVSMMKRNFIIASFICLLLYLLGATRKGDFYIAINNAIFTLAKSKYYAKSLKAPFNLDEVLKAVSDVVRFLRENLHKPRKLYDFLIEASERYKQFAVKQRLNIFVIPNPDDSQPPLSKRKT